MEDTVLECDVNWALKVIDWLFIELETVCRSDAPSSEKLAALGLISTAFVQTIDYLKFTIRHGE